MPRKVIILCYDDPLNPKSGGAPRYCFEMGRRLVHEGFQVIWLSSRFKGGARDQTLAGVRFLRSGSEYTTYVHSGLRLAVSYPDAIVFESISAIPFFTPVLAPNRTLSMIHHIVPNVTITQKVGLVAPLVAGIQNILTPVMYRSAPIITNSKSTLEELSNLGYRNLRSVRLGVDVPEPGKVSLQAKEKSIVIVGPLRPWKRIEHGLRAFATLPKEWNLVVIGPFESKEYQAELMSTAKQLGVADRTRFTGRISDADKNDIYRRASISIVTSEKEGWGLAAAEPQAYGCPVVGYDVPGIRDSVCNGLTGVLVRSGDLLALSAALSQVAEDPSRLRELAASAYSLYRSYSWDEVFRDFLEIFTSQFGL